MSAPPYNYADVTFRIAINGDGRKDSYVMRPVSAALAAAWSPPVALATQSPMVRLSSCQGTQSINATQINTMLPYTASYLAFVPINVTDMYGSTTIKGSALESEAGIPIIPSMPCILALPNPLPNTWTAIYTPSYSGSQIDVYLW